MAGDPRPSGRAGTMAPGSPPPLHHHQAAQAACGAEEGKGEQVLRVEGVWWGGGPRVQACGIRLCF